VAEFAIADGKWTSRVSSATRAARVEVRRRAARAARVRHPAHASRRDSHLLPEFDLGIIKALRRDRDSYRDRIVTGT